MTLMLPEDQQAQFSLATDLYLFDGRELSLPEPSATMFNNFKDIMDGSRKRQKGYNNIL